MKKLLFLFSTLLIFNNCNTMEKWHTAHDKMMSIKPGTSREEQDNILDEVLDNLTKFNAQLSENPVGVIRNNNRTHQSTQDDEESKAIIKEYTELQKEAEQLRSMKEGRKKDKKINELQKRRDTLKLRTQRWEEKNNLSPLPPKNNNTNVQHQPDESTYEESDHSFDTKQYVEQASTWLSERSEKSTEQQEEFDKLLVKGLDKAKKLNSLNRTKMLLIAGASCTALSGWIAYKNKHRFIEQCNRCDTKKLAKTILYVGCGSAVFVAGLYGYKKLVNRLGEMSKNKDKPESVTIVSTNSEYEPTYQDKVQHLKDKYNKHTTERIQNRSTQNSYWQETKEELSSDIEHLKKTTRDTIEAAPELLQEMGNDISKTIKKGWRSFKNWLNK